MDQCFLDLILTRLPEGVQFSIPGNEIVSNPMIDLESLLSKNEKKLLGENASEKRVREFSLGRLAAKSALKKVFSNSHEGDFEILRKNLRAPLWPVGSVGSISHCSNRAIAIAARSDRYKGLGVDMITNKRVVNQKILNVLCSLEEQSTLINSWNGDLNLLKLIVFSAKESLYKLFSNLNVTQMEWADFRLELPSGDFDLSDFQFIAEFSASVGNKMKALGIIERSVTGISVSVLVSDEFVLSFCAL